MISIKKVILENFQTHKKTEIEFSPNFNVIVGPTRSGKSSLVRALDFLLYNNWYEDYQRFYSDACTITVLLSNGKKVIRTKNSKTNKIVVEEPSGEVKRFESFGFTLPDEVVATLGVIPIDIGTKDPILANVANQDDPLFLLYATGTDKTKVLSKLSGLHWIDYALKDLNNDRHTNTKSIQLLKDTNDQLTEKLKSFKNIEIIKSQLVIEKKRLVTLKQIDTLCQRGKLLVSKVSLWKTIYQEVQNLKQIDFVVEKERLNRLIRVAEIQQTLKDLERKISTNTHSINNIHTQMNMSIEMQRSLEKEIAEESSKISTCPTCGQEIKNEQESKCHST